MNVIYHGLKSRLVNGCKLDRIFTIFTMNNGKVNKYVVLNLLGSPSKIRNKILIYSHLLVKGTLFLLKNNKIYVHTEVK